MGLPKVGLPKVGLSKVGLPEQQPEQLQQALTSQFQRNLKTVCGRGLKNQE